MGMKISKRFPCHSYGSYVSKLKKKIPVTVFTKVACMIFKSQI